MLKGNVMSRLKSAAVRIGKFSKKFMPNSTVTFRHDWKRVYGRIVRNPALTILIIVVGFWLINVIRKGLTNV